MQIRGHGHFHPKEAHDGEARRDIPMIDSVLGRMADDLQPLRMEPPRLSEGLTPVSFADGLQELSVDAMRANGGQVHKRRRVGEADVLAAAARRADQLGIQ